MLRRTFLKATLAITSLFAFAGSTLAKAPSGARRLASKIRTKSPFWTHIDPVEVKFSKDSAYPVYVVATMTNPATRTTRITRDRNAEYLNEIANAPGRDGEDWGKVLPVPRPGTRRREI